MRGRLIGCVQQFHTEYSYFIIIYIIYRSLGTLPPAAASQPEPRALMKRGGQTTLSLSGSMRLTSPASSLSACSAVSARTPRTAAPGRTRSSGRRAAPTSRRVAAPRQRASLRSYLQGERPRGWAIVLFWVFRSYIRAEGVIKV